MEPSKLRERAATLPPASGHVEVHLLNAGSFMADTRVMHQGSTGHKFRLYNWAFAIHHREQNRKIIWDVGIVGDPEVYTPFWQKAAFSSGLNPVSPRKSIVEQIHSVCGWEADDVDTVIFSHAHWDHCRPCSGTFPRAKMFFGPGTAQHCGTGHFAKPESEWDGHFFDPEKRTEDWAELNGPWQPFGAFDHALDLLGDGSFWIMQAPGHMPGNLCAAVRLANGEHIMFAGDCCHSRELYLGKCDFAVWEVNGRPTSLQEDIPAARDTLGRIRLMEKHYGFHVALAHDSTWLVDQRDPTLLGLMEHGLRAVAVEAVPKDEPF